jgi:hypothetical protein
MELPILAPAPVVTEHAAVFRDVFENQCQFRHFQHYLTGLIVLPNKSLANIARCILDSADTTNLSRFFSEAPWRADEINRRRIRLMLQETKPHRHRRRESLVVIDDTLCEHVGSLFDHVDRHYNHSDGTYPLAHNPVTSFYVSGPVRFPLGLRLYRGASSKPSGTPVGNKGARCCRSSWCSSMTSCPRVPQVTVSLRRYLPSSGAWFPCDPLWPPQITTVELK